MTAIELEHIMEMPVEQKILLIEDVWDSMRLKAKEVPVPDSHKRELDRRFEKHERHPENLLDERQLRAALNQRD